MDEPISYWRKRWFFLLKTLVWGRFFCYLGRVKKTALNLLGWLAGLVARKYKVKIVAVTGSVGKTTTKEAIFSVLSQVYEAQRNLYNANTEWGAAASVISPGFEPVFTESGKAKISLVQFVQLVWQAKMKLVFKLKYPQVLVLELAADRPGDIKWFNQWFKYDVAVITTIGNSHLEFYKDQAELTAEKLSLVNGLKPEGLVVINGECTECRQFISETKKRLVKFGWEQSNTYWAEPLDTVSYVLHGPEGKLDVSLPLGRQFGLAALAAVAAGDEFALTLEQSQSGLSSFEPLGGRFQVQKTERWTVIDDTYNASPESMKMALENLRNVPGKRRVAILGGMKELGSATEEGHLAVGRMAARLVDLLVVAGREGEVIGKGAMEAGMPREKIVKLIWDEDNPDADEAISQLLPILEEGDSVLVKASRAIRLDKLAGKLLAQKLV